MSERKSVAMVSIVWVCALAGMICGEVGLWTERGSAAEQVDLWSLRPPVKPAVPEQLDVVDRRRGGNAIDALILLRVQQAGLAFAPQAERRTLVRRAYFDLIGLPPSPEQVAAFVNDTSADAWPRLIDHLLESKHYGERWGRHWLDVVRYADSGGYETDIYYRNAWRYRDYVVKSFNDDKPYDRFVQEQIAGDELWPDNLDLDPKRVYVVSDEKKKHLEARIGTGMYALGSLVHESGLDAKKLCYERLTDWVDTTGSAFLGLTIGCARCHDHKFDPISQRDYFGLQAAFAGSIEVQFPLLTAMEINDTNQFYPRIIAVEEARTAYRLFETRVAGRALTGEEQEEKRNRLEAIALRVLELPRNAGSQPSSPYVGLMEVPTVSVLGHERPELVPLVQRLERGEMSDPRETITAALPESLVRATGHSSALPGPYGSRKELALWLTQPNHPLTARVLVNRVWHWHFGRGIVSTPNDFGLMGTSPSHPELLDWLAVDFVQQGWSLKHLHRLIMQSQTYQQSSDYAAEASLAVDPENRLLWRMNRRRLEAETLWDAVHAVSGTINLEMGGRPIVPPLAEDEIAALRERWQWPVSADPRQHTRRGMYILVRRNFKFPMFEAFDAPVASVSCPARDVTTVAPQALWGLNNRSVFKQATQFAERVKKEVGTDPGLGVERAWILALGRLPSPVEKDEAMQLLQQLAAQAAAEDSTVPFATFCLALYNLNEFLFVD